ncbi:MAG: YfcE family phosphodiesterase [Lachnospiraceae bacterium]
MKIVITSDCHGNDEFLKKIAVKEKDADWVVHCGDSCGLENRFGYIFQNSKVAMVAGNCDFSPFLREYIIFEAGKFRVFVFHGNQVQGYEHRKIAYLGKRRGCNVVMCGHTHVPFVDTETDPEVTIINPGSVARPRQENRKKSYAVMKIDDDGNAEYEIIYDA